MNSNSKIAEVQIFVVDAKPTPFSLGLPRFKFVLVD
jgi:hypothetical protein